MNYNARIYSNLSLVWKFRDRGVSLQVFESYDGGGSCGYIVEFVSKDDLNAFVEEYGTPRPRTWIEHDDGKIEYLP